MEKSILLGVYFSALLLTSFPGAMSSISKSFIDNEVVPDVLATAPQEALTITYPSGVQVSEGKELTPTNVKDIPTVEWKADSNSFYTLCMTDPDAPSRAEPVRREFLHWLVVNIPGKDITKGDVIAEYIGSGPPNGTSLHRYVFILYKQPGKINVTETKANSRTRDGRPSFSIAKFASKYSLGNPVAGNFYQAQYDDYVPNIHKQLGL